MPIHVPLKVCLSRNVGSYVLALRAGIDTLAMESVGARVVGRPYRTPFMFPVAVQICANTIRSFRIGQTVLAPHVIHSPCVHIAIRIENGDDVEFCGVKRSCDAGV
eukprot:Lithocolla_globosa_v1_NODE_4631_length_1395_cov_357.856930.p2 type:complete len:106 gc:universal NODE_4631_length_1395_cov_357.856930:982-665(-)